MSLPRNRRERIRLLPDAGLFAVQTTAQAAMLLNVWRGLTLGEYDSVYSVCSVVDKRGVDHGTHGVHGSGGSWLFVSAVPLTLGIPWFKRPLGLNRIQ